MSEPTHTPTHPPTHPPELGLVDLIGLVEDYPDGPLVVLEPHKNLGKQHTRKTKRAAAGSEQAMGIRRRQAVQRIASQSIVQGKRKKKERRDEERKATKSHHSIPRELNHASPIHTWRLLPPRAFYARPGGRGSERTRGVGDTYGSVKSTNIHTKCASPSACRIYPSGRGRGYQIAYAHTRRPAPFVSTYRVRRGRRAQITILVIARFTKNKPPSARR